MLSQRLIVPIAIFLITLSSHQTAHAQRGRGGGGGARAAAERDRKAVVGCPGRKAVG